MLFLGILLLVLFYVIWNVRWTETSPFSSRIDRMRVAPFYRILAALILIPAGVTMIVGALNG